MTKLMMPMVLFIIVAPGVAQEPPSEPAIQELSALLLQQKEIIEAQRKELEELKKRLSEVEALALTSHNRLAELEQQPKEETVTGAVEQRLAELEQQVEKIPEIPADVVEAGEFPGSFRIPGTDAAMKIGGQVRMEPDGVSWTRGSGIAMKKLLALAAATRFFRTPQSKTRRVHVPLSARWCCNGFSAVPACFVR